MNRTARHLSIAATMVPERLFGRARQNERQRGIQARLLPDRANDAGRLPRLPTCLVELVRSHSVSWAIPRLSKGAAAQ